MPSSVQWPLTSGISEALSFEYQVTGLVRESSLYPSKPFSPLPSISRRSCLWYTCSCFAWIWYWFCGEDECIGREVYRWVMLAPALLSLEPGAPS